MEIFALCRGKTYEKLFSLVLDLRTSVLPSSYLVIISWPASKSHRNCFVKPVRFRHRCLYTVHLHTLASWFIYFFCIFFSLCRTQLHNWRWIGKTSVASWTSRPWILNGKAFSFSLPLTTARTDDGQTDEGVVIGAVMRWYSYVEYIVRIFLPSIRLRTSWFRQSNQWQ